LVAARRDVIEGSKHLRPAGIPTVHLQAASNAVERRGPYDGHGQYGLIPCK